jgi:hypothetical protein
MIQHELSFGPFQRSRPSPWSHCVILAGNFAGPDKLILDYTIRDPKDPSKMAFTETAAELIAMLVKLAGRIYLERLGDYDDSRVHSVGVKHIQSLTQEQRQAIVAAGSSLSNAEYSYDISGLIRELVRLLTGIAILSGQHLWEWSADADMQRLAWYLDHLSTSHSSDRIDDVVLLGDVFDSWVFPHDMKLPQRSLRYRKRAPRIALREAQQIKRPNHLPLGYIISRLAATDTRRTGSHEPSATVMAQVLLQGFAKETIAQEVVDTIAQMAGVDDSAQIQMPNYIGCGKTTTVGAVKSKCAKLFSEIEQRNGLNGTAIAVPAETGNLAALAQSYLFRLGTRLVLMGHTHTARRHSSSITSRRLLTSIPDAGVATPRRLTGLRFTEAKCRRYGGASVNVRLNRQPQPDLGRWHRLWNA